MIPFAGQYGRRRSAISRHRYFKRPASRSASSAGTAGTSETPGRGSHSSSTSIDALPASGTTTSAEPGSTSSGRSVLSSRSNPAGGGGGAAARASLTKMSASRHKTDAPGHTTNTASRVAYTCTGAPTVRGSARTANGSFVAAKKSARSVRGLPITTNSGTSVGSIPAASSAFSASAHASSMSGCEPSRGSVSSRKNQYPNHAPVYINRNSSGSQ